MIQDTQRVRETPIGPESGGVYIMRIATVLLAIVSWWATAQGMAECVFADQWQANLASLAVQSILLGLNFYFPVFIRRSKNILAKIILSVLVLVVLSCSSWFSYVFIVGKTYERSWDTDSQLLVQSTYRAELYDASDYADEYTETLRDDLTGQIAGLYEQASVLEAQNIQITDNLNLEQDRSEYANNDDFAAQSIIASAITSMEQALQENASAGDREQASTILSELESQANSQIEQLDVDIQTARTDTNQAESRLETARRNLNNPPEGADIADLQDSYQAAQNRYDECIDREAALDKDRSDYSEALRIITQYLSYLGISASNTGTQIAVSLRDIQIELLQTDPNMETIEDQAIEIFERIQSANSFSVTGDTNTYQSLLNNMNSFIRDSRTYSSVKIAAQGLDDLTSDLRNTAIDTDGWKSIWTDKLNELKLEIGSLPTYTGTTSSTLRAYDRTDSMDRLDKMIQRYITDHNAVDQAIIYLLSPYNGLGIFSLVLAYFLDIAAFVTGFVIDAVDKNERKMDSELQEHNRRGDDCMEAPMTARRYVYLTGNFSKEDDKYYYQAIEGIEETEVEMDKPELPVGFYVELKNSFRPVMSQTLSLYQMQSTPCDGIYQQCYLQHTDHILSTRTEEESVWHFLASMEKDTPLYRVRQNQCVLESVQDIPPETRMRTAILSLNGKGTTIAAVFLEEEIVLNQKQAGSNG